MKTIKEYYEEIEAIENNPSNTVGGIKALMSGYNTQLTERAKKQIKAIERKIEELADDCDDE